MQSAVTEADAPGQLEGGARQTGEILAHWEAEAGEVSINELPDGGKKIFFVIHLYN